MALKNINKNKAQKAKKQDDFLGGISMKERQKKQKKKGKTDLIKEYFDEITVPKALRLDYDSDKEEFKQMKQDQNDAAMQKERIKEEADGISKKLLEGALEGGGGVTERAITGNIRFIKMEQLRVIKEVDTERYDREILKNSEFQFLDNRMGGFEVQLVYNELNPLVITNKPDTAILEEFTITQDNLAEMRRNFAFQSTIIFGMLQFRVTEFVRLINNIVSMNDIFSTL